MLSQPKIKSLKNGRKGKTLKRGQFTVVAASEMDIWKSSEIAKNIVTAPSFILSGVVRCKLTSLTTTFKQDFAMNGHI